MAALAFLTSSMNGLFYSYLDTCTGRSLRSVNMEIAENVTTHVNKCHEADEAPWPRSVYFEKGDSCFLQFPNMKEPHEIPGGYSGLDFILNGVHVTRPTAPRPGGPPAPRIVADDASLYVLETRAPDGTYYTHYMTKSTMNNIREVRHWWHVQRLLRETRRKDDDSEEDFE
jgi:hypothetical protein